jgi:hypothetical protein
LRFLRRRQAAGAAAASPEEAAFPAAEWAEAEAAPGDMYQILESDDYATLTYLFYENGLEITPGIQILFLDKF